MARVNFDTLFVKHEDGTIEPTQRIRVGGVTIGPGLKIRKGVSFGGIDFHDFIDRDFSVDTDNDVLVIKAIYAKTNP